MGSTTSSTADRIGSAGPIVFGRTLDWAIGAVLALLGLLAGALGVGLYGAAGRPAVAELVRSSEFRWEGLTEAEAIDALVALGQWTGIGLVVAGALSILAGVAVVIAHGRARRAGRRTPRWIVGLVGGLVGVVLAFLPFSPAIGGGVAGYLDPNRSASGIGIGTIAGLVGAIPVVVVGGFAVVGLVVAHPGEGATVLLTALGIAFVVSMALVVGMSAVGGYVGRWIRQR